MANSSPVGRRPQIELVNDLAEAGLELVAEHRELSAQRAGKLRVIASLEEADQIERERVRHRIERAQVSLQEAQAELREAKDDQERLDEIRSEIWKAVLELEKQEERATDAGERHLSIAATRAGFAYLHPDLAQPQGMVAERKRRRVSGVISAREAEVI